jgi:hypothetical protein
MHFLFNFPRPLTLRHQGTKGWWARKVEEEMRQQLCFKEMPFTVCAKCVSGHAMSSVRDLTEELAPVLVEVSCMATSGFESIQRLYYRLKMFCAERGGPSSTGGGCCEERTGPLRATLTNRLLSKP